MEMSGSAADSALSLDVDVIEGVVVLRARGEIDVLTAQMFEEALDRAASRLKDGVLIVDLSEVAFLASAGLAVLVRCSDDIPAGNRFIVAAHGPATVRPLELTGLTEVLEVHPSVEAALSTV
ncbi:anti-sigma factor antagonist [Rhodococcus hoagii]|jgi:anti-anti-sigma factor|uniref:Anti-sigma factor antagonist n=3 Tax=Rhodococcus hoagii TaxID=43767 RepID=E9T1K8_RHOHA|nr:anti-sigma factor antagonist [Prescottella equi]MBU4613436.1 anti-sigma factor antagonist [Rhodococcus sp. GG48]MCD7053190.1 anti-sigma factor antagonist [Rhodococcus sp. BH2-1]GBF14367.1 anti-sigma-F factor antagonist RsfB [Rhodococcus sp. Br-6]EGD23879.1 STAS domain protein [Prescottella equi ATCC 33707]ERN47224.1 anti sigma factor antagonist [Prescottella equi NBRC 101255 = C 7]